MSEKILLLAALVSAFVIEINALTLQNEHDYRLEIDRYLTKNVKSLDFSDNMAAARSWLMKIGPYFDGISKRAFMAHGNFLTLEKLLNNDMCNMIGRQILLNNYQARSEDSATEVSNLARYNELVNYASLEHAKRCVPVYLKTLHDRCAKADQDLMELLESYTAPLLDGSCEARLKQEPFGPYELLQLRAFEHLEQHRNNPDVKEIMYNDNHKPISYKNFANLVRNYIGLPCEYFQEKTKDLLESLQYIDGFISKVEGVGELAKFYKQAKEKYQICRKVTGSSRGKRDWIVTAVAKVAHDRLDLVVENEAVMNRLLGKFSSG